MHSSEAKTETSIKTEDDLSFRVKNPKGRQTDEVSMANGLFIVGNKRSGSTHLMRLLNLHPKIFVSNESDVIWILYNYCAGKEIKPYPHDSPGGMEAAMKKAGHVLNRGLSAHENFENFQTSLMRQGFLKQKGVQKTDLAYLGDQKPYQNIDPDLVPFILDNVRSPKFLHILRHPFEVVSSSMNFDGGTGGDIWNGMGPRDIMKMWEVHERHVLEAREKYNLDILTVRYDGLIGDTMDEMRRVFQFLEVEYSEDLLETCRQNTLPNFKKIRPYPTTASQLELMRHYDLPADFNWVNRRLIPALRRNFYKLKLKFA